MIDNSLKIQVIDNFLDNSEWSLIDSIMNSNIFPWYFDEYIKKWEKSNRVLNEENWFFNHLFYDQYEFKSSADFISVLIKKIDPISIIKIRANLTFPLKQQKELGFHVDDNFNGKTAVYYLNSNNGKTIFEDGTTIDSVKNRILIFNSNLKHSPIFSTDKKRIVINFNYIPRMV